MSSVSDSDLRIGGLSDLVLFGKLRLRFGKSLGLKRDISQPIVCKRERAPVADLLGRFVAVDLVNEETGEIYAEAGEELTEPKLTALEEAGITRLPTLAVDQSSSLRAHWNSRARIARPNGMTTTLVPGTGTTRRATPNMRTLNPAMAVETLRSPSAAAVRG